MESISLTVPMKIEIDERFVTGSIKIENITIEEGRIFGSLVKEFVKSLEKTLKT